jgi:hypothetical protein
VRPAGPGVSPLDDELGLLPGVLSPTLAEGVTRLAAWMPFARAAEQVAFFWRARPSEATVRRHSEAAGAAYVAVQTAAVARLEREAPPAPPGPPVQLLSADGAMVPLVRGEWAEVKTLAIGTVGAPRWDAPAGEWVVPTTDLSYFARLTDAATFSRLALVETHRRGTETAGVVCAVADGAEWVQGLLDAHCPDAVRILDVPHAVEHLATAAQAAFGVGTAAAAAWLAAQAHDLKHGDPTTVLAGLAARPPTTAPNPAAATAPRDATLGYLTGRWAQIQYAQFRAAGYPIGSGAVESANKLVVEARLKGAGMHWARAHVAPMLGLRTVACANRWGETWPPIVTQRRAQAATQRRQRCRAHQPAGASPPPLAAPVVPAPRRPSVAVPQLPPLRSGRSHPWRRPFSTAERIRQAATARL